MENNFLTRITAPTLGSSTFATDLREVFQNIDDNFKKIVSAPYLEGQEGNSVEAYDMPIVEDGELTDFGAAMMREILSDPSIETMEDITSNSIYDSVYPAQHHIYDCIVDHPTMKVLRTIDPDTNEVDRWICGAEYYCFVDMRIEDLGNNGYPSSQTTFVDYSCLVFAEYEDGEWKFTKGNMMPTLYYSSEQSCFCWKVNGMETGIRAQGVKGDDGRPPKAAVVKGFGSLSDIGTSKVVRIMVTEYSVFDTHIDGGGELVVETSWGNIQDSGLQDGDLVVCIFTITDPTYTMTYPDMIVANIRITGEGESAVYTITAPDINRMSSLWRSYLLFYACKDIDYKSTLTTKTKALFIPSSTQGVAHSIFQDDSGVNYTVNDDVWSSVDTLNEDNLVFKKVKESKLVGEGSLGNRMTDNDQDTDYMSKAKFLGYEMEVDGTSKATVSGVPGTLLGVPVGSVVNWMDMSRIPDGWFVTGETTDYAPPVFGLRYTAPEATDYDVVVMNGDTVVQKAIITSMDNMGGFGTRDRRFIGIFCTLSGNDYTDPVVVQTTFNNITDYIAIERFNWNLFDLEEVRGTGVKFYLTKYIS